MFKNILIPISSEFYTKEVLEQGVFLTEKFKSTITLIYIIEEKTLEQTDKRTDGFITHYDMTKTRKKIIQEQTRAADEIVFDDAKLLFKNKNITFEEKICRGEFSSVIKNELDKKDYDLILMGFAKGCMLNYRLLHDVDAPIWIETKNESKSILAVCSNLAPNQKVPDIGIKLSKALNWDLNMLYVVDMGDSVEVDKNGVRSEKKPERDLIFSGQNFVEKMKKKGVNVELVKGNLEKETIKAAKRINANLVIVGREQKKKGLLGLPVKHLKRKMVEKCDYSILFVN